MTSNKSDKAHAEQQRLRAHAQLAIQGGKGIYNVRPGGWLLGLVGGFLAIVYALYAATRTPGETAPPPTAPPPETETLIWVE